MSGYACYTHVVMLVPPSVGETVPACLSPCPVPPPSEKAAAHSHQERQKAVCTWQIEDYVNRQAGVVTGAVSPSGE